MRKDIHPAYQQVLVSRYQCRCLFLIGSTIQTKQTKEYQGKVYPYVTLDISAHHIRFIQVKCVRPAMRARVASFNKRFSRFLTARLNLVLSFD